MVAQESARRMTVEEWRELLAHSDVKYEYSDGWVYAMAGGTADHARIAINVIRALEDALGEAPCRVYNSDMAVRLSPTQYRFPDASVTCDERDRGRVTEIHEARLLVEVLSDSTEGDDRTDKAPLYQACPSVQEYVFIATRLQAVEVYRRPAASSQSEDWTIHLYRPGEEAVLTSIDVRLPLSAFYRLTEVPAGRRPHAPPARESANGPS